MGMLRNPVGVENHNRICSQGSGFRRNPGLYDAAPLGQKTNFYFLSDGFSLRPCVSARYNHFKNADFNLRESASSADKNKEIFE